MKIYAQGQEDVHISKDPFHCGWYSYEKAQENN